MLICYDYILYPKLFECTFCTLNCDPCYTLRPNIKFAINLDGKILHYVNRSNCPSSQSFKNKDKLHFTTLNYTSDYTLHPITWVILQSTKNAFKKYEVQSVEYTMHALVPYTCQTTTFISITLLTTFNSIIICTVLTSHTCYCSLYLLN